MTATARFTRIEELQLEALSAFRTKSQVLRDALALLWEKEGEHAMKLYEKGLPVGAEELRALMDAAGHVAKETE